jgi:cellulose biosynthesis protein BcsQ
MSVICFASLKGGVGKTSLSLNVAHAFARRGCTTLLIDLDPSGHASRFFRRAEIEHMFPTQAPLARAFLSREQLEEPLSFGREPGETEGSLPFIVPVRPDFDLLPGGPELRYFIPAQGAVHFGRRFAAMLAELETHYDHIIIDTAPDFNVLTRNAVALAHLVVAPVDSSEMGVYSVEELLAFSTSLRKPVWAIVRTMVYARAETTQLLANNRLHATLLRFREPAETQDAQFLSLFSQWRQGSQEESGKRKIFLLDSVVYRTDFQNQLTFLRKTAFDGTRTEALARQYLGIAKELEDVLIGAAPEVEMSLTA